MGLPYSTKYPVITSIIYQKEKVQHFNNKNVIKLVRAKKGKTIDWAQIINSLCSEDTYVKENKRDKKDACQSALVLAKIFQYLFVHQKDTPQKPPAKVKSTREEMQKTLEN
jgi:hypothetical protein